MTFVGKFYPNPANEMYLDQSPAGCDVESAPEVGRGIMQGIFPYRYNRAQFTFNESDYLSEITDFTQPWPSARLAEVTDLDVMVFNKSDILYVDC